MRFSRWLLVSPLLLSLAASQACVSDDSSSPSLPDVTLPDASFDAALSDSGSGDAGALTDAAAPIDSSVDTGIDASVEADADANAPVTIVVVDDTNQPRAGVKVAFIDSTGTTIQTTANDGTASAPVGAGGSVLVADRDVGARRFTSVLAVEGGDVIQVRGLGAVPPDPPSAGSVYLGTVAAPDGAFTFDFNFGCVSVGIDSTVQIPANCVHQGKVDMLGSARDEGGNIAYYTTRSVDLPDAGGPVTVDVASSDWVAAPADGAITFTGNVPPYVAGSYVEVDFLKNQIQYTSESVNPPLPLSSFTFALPPAGFADLMREAVSLDFDDGADGGTQSAYVPSGLYLVQQVPPAAGMTSLVYDQFLPRIHSLNVADSTDITVSWSSEAAVSSLGGYLRMTGSSATEAGFDDVEWVAFFPPSVTQVAVPPVPAQLPEFQLTDPLTLESIALIDSPDVGSAKNFRQSGGLYTQILNSTSSVPALPTTVRATGLKRRPL